MMSATLTAPSTPAAAAAFVPQRVSSIEETGLDISFLADLALKIVYQGGVLSGSTVASVMKLPFYGVIELVMDALKMQRHLEIRAGGGPLPPNYMYALTDRGQNKVREVLQRSQYTGPCPVPLEHYVAAVGVQSVRNVAITRETITHAFRNMVLNKRMLDQLGPAINSGRSMFLFGPPGNGKTTIAEIASGCLGGDVYIPHAVVAEGQIIHVFDEVHHKAVASPVDVELVDERWVRSRRPVVVVGGELTLDALDLTYSENAKVYQAPLQMKANCGMFLIDDFGRQKIGPTELLNRWIVPLERRVDYLTLATGSKLKMPFDELIIFSTNLAPKDLVDDAFLRRIHYKIEVSAPSPDEYREIFRRMAVIKGVQYSEQAVSYIMTEYYQRQGIEPRACHPRDLLDQIIDMALYHQVPAAMTRELVDLACRSYFVRLS